jgi:cell division protein FtsB
MTANLVHNFVTKNNITKPLFITYFITLAAILYFASFTVLGEKGLMEFFTLQKKIENKAGIKEELSAKMQAKKNMVEGMNLDSLDIDLLDEQARKVLGYAEKNEVVIYQNQE